MNKDVIYIDVEDDITAIIGKIKAAKEKIVALVPPKRIGILQSAVNLRLLARMAENSNKRLVLITNNDALIALSATALIPVAKNLQSKPEIAEIAALEIDEGEDVIDGAQLPIGELAKTADLEQDKDVTKVIETIDIEDKDSKSSKTPPKSGVKVPDFPRFRKKLFLGIALGILLTAFLIWANIYAPAAKVIITAKTSPAPVSMTVKLGGTVATDVAKSIIQTVSKQIKKDVSVDFTATGTATVGEKAKGNIVFNNCDTSTQETIDAGTYISVGAKNYIIQSDTVVSAGTFAGGACSSAGTSIPTAVIATVIGADYNVNADTEFLVSGYSDKMTAITTAGLSGGTSHEAKIVTAGDIQKAGQALVDLPSNDVKQQLIDQFINGETVIAESFDIARAAAVSVPAVGAEATSKARLTSATTYSITAIAKSELLIYLKDALGKQISNAKNQRIYNDGIDKVVLSGYFKTDQGSTVNIGSIGQIGPNIDEASIKEQVKGKRYGDIQSLIGAIEGVSSVDTKFSYFWVTNVPNDVNKIEVEFRLQDV